MKNVHLLTEYRKIFDRTGDPVYTEQEISPWRWLFLNKKLFLFLDRSGILDPEPAWASVNHFPGEHVWKGSLQK